MLLSKIQISRVRNNSPTGNNDKIPRSLINRIASLKASAKVLFDEVTQTEKEFERYYPLTP